MCLNAYMFMYVCLVPTGQKSFESPGTGVIAIVGCHVGTGIETRSSAKNKCS